MHNLNLTETNFKDENEFELNLVKKLLENGWKNNIYSDLKIDNELSFVNTDDLELNWLNILNHINRDKLDGNPITKEELSILIKDIDAQPNISYISKNIIKENQGLNLKRDGKIIPLKLIDKFQFNDDGGKNYFQIARQVKVKNQEDEEKRLDVLLLINGMPLIHIELKDGDKSIDGATNQLKNYNYGSKTLYNGILKLVHIVVGMTPILMEYSPRNKDLKFIKWYDENDHHEINNWKEVVKNFLSIPMSLELVCDYTIPDKNELKVLRSYQYYAVKKILNKIKKNDLNTNDTSEPIKGGYIWHATGSGKTFTSLKASSMIIEYGLADLVIFVADRIELVDQTFNIFKKHDDENVTDTNSARHLANMIKTEENPIIVTSIHKLDRISEVYKNILDKKRIVLIFDEAHRSTFGSMMEKIRKLFNKKTIFFGFTGTPILKGELTTKDIFGEQLHSYTLGHAIIQDKVLKFHFKYSIFDELYKWSFNCNEKGNFDYCSKELNSFNSINDLKQKNKILQSDLSNNTFEIMEEFNEKTNNLEKLVDLENKIDYIYKTDLFKNLVVEDILQDISHLKESYSSLFATSSIQDAMKYFEIFENHVKKSENEKIKNIKFTVLFTKYLDNEETVEKNEKLDIFFNKLYKKYEKDFGIKILNQKDEHDFFKKDISSRLKRENIKDEHEVLDLLIVVDQMLTGFDSPYIQTVYFDKIQDSQNLVQSVSRTNRKLNSSKNFGRAIFYRKPNTMAKNVEDAFTKYAYENLEKITTKKIEEYYSSINKNFKEISDQFNELELSWFKPMFEQFNLEDKELISKLKKLLRNLLTLWTEMNNINLLGFNWEIHGKNILFDNDVEERIKPKIIEINRILSAIPKQSTETEEDSDVKIFYDSLEFIHNSKKQQEYNKDFFYKIQKKILNEKTPDLNRILSAYSIENHDWIIEWFNTYKDHNIDLDNFYKQKKENLVNELIEQISNKFLISKEKILEFIREVYIDVEEDIDKNNNFDDKIWKFVNIRGPKYKFKNDLKKQIKNLKEKYRG